MVGAMIGKKHMKNKWRNCVKKEIARYLMLCNEIDGGNLGNWKFFVCVFRGVFMMENFFKQCLGSCDEICDTN